MIGEFFLNIGLPPSIALSAAVITVAVLLFGAAAMLFWAAQRADARKRQKVKNQTTLRNAHRAYNRYKSFEDSVTALIGPAMTAFRDALKFRDGVTYPRLFYEVSQDKVTLIASFKPDLSDVWDEQTRKMDVGMEYFDAPHDIVDIVTDLVLRDEADASPANYRRMDVINAARECN